MDIGPIGTGLAYILLAAPVILAFFYFKKRKDEKNGK